VRYAETDAMGIVHHSAYIVWFEAARSDFMRRIGSSYSAVERAGFYFRLAELGARYLAPAFYDELITVRTWISEMHSRELVFCYTVLRPSDPVVDRPEQVLATGFTKLICTDAGGHVRRLPDETRRQFESLIRERSGNDLS
jgi:acyl-CoA thioester hydrolase